MALTRMPMTKENRLISVTRDSDTAVVGQYQYDALGRRVQKIANPAGSPTTTVYFYDGGRVVEEQNGVSAAQATYVYGNYVDEILTMNRDSQTYYYHQNALWSVEAITNTAAATVEQYSYDAYGAVTVRDGFDVLVPANAWGTQHSNIGNPYLFTGRQFEEETGLYYYRARYYDTFEGRFHQRDPREYTDGMDLYAYVGDKPTRFVDPSGEVIQVCCDPVGGGLPVVPAAALPQHCWVNVVGSQTQAADGSPFHGIAAQGGRNDYPDSPCDGLSGDGFRPLSGVGNGGASATRGSRRDRSAPDLRRRSGGPDHGHSARHQVHIVHRRMHQRQPGAGDSLRDGGPRRLPNRLVRSARDRQR